MRTVPEWIGKTHDSRIPNNVRVRVFDRFHGRCQCEQQGCGFRKIVPPMKWEVHHAKPLWNGGEHRESNFVPVLTECHKTISSRDRTIKAKGDRLRLKQLGIKKPRTMTKWRRFDGSIVHAPRERT